MRDSGRRGARRARCRRPRRPVRRAALTILVDTSVLTRLSHPTVRNAVEPLAAEGQLGRPRICDLEIGYSARNASDWDTLIAALDLAEATDTTTAHLRRALQVQRLLAERSRRRRKIPDLLVAAAAESLGLAVLHDDGGYANQGGFQLYDTSGSTEDWSYWQTGGLGFTYEIGPDGFHPAYEEAVVAEYLGLEPAAGAGKGGNREAYYRMAEATIDPANHSVIRGDAPAGRTITVRKQFLGTTSPVIQPDGTVGEPLTYENDLSSSYTSTGGTFRIAVNPSTRPVVAGRWGRDPLAPPQPGQPLTNPAGTPAVGASESTTFTIEGMPQYDNAKAEIRVQWPDATVDWDVFVYDEQGREVGSAASEDNPEVAVLIDPVPGTYRVELNNYAGGETSDWTGDVTFRSPDPEVVTGVKEAWTLTCSASGKVIASKQVVVDRGDVANVGNACKKRKG
ncbi:MAG: PIN domain-containing protein [Dermatophilaceae bacterium]